MAIDALGRAESRQDARYDLLKYPGAELIDGKIKYTPDPAQQLTYHLPESRHRLFSQGSEVGAEAAAADNRRMRADHPEWFCTLSGQLMQTPVKAAGKNFDYDALLQAMKASSVTLEDEHNVKLVNDEGEALIEYIDKTRLQNMQAEIDDYLAQGSQVDPGASQEHTGVWSPTGAAA